MDQVMNIIIAALFIFYLVTIFIFSKKVDKHYESIKIISFVSLVGLVAYFILF